jgi:hypothetical protein
MRLDVQRIWKRNMGRDDRCISDHGKEVGCLISVFLIFYEFECLKLTDFRFTFLFNAAVHPLQARFPFLDENVIKTLLDIPLWEIAKLDEPVGKGDKKILREVCT